MKRCLDGADGQDLKSKEICTYFYRKVDLNKFECLCGTIRCQDTTRGYSNLVAHIKTEHSNYSEIMRAYPDPSSAPSFFPVRAQTIFAWMDLIVMEGFPFAR